MAQLTTVLKGDPATVKLALQTIANSAKIQIVRKLVSAAYLVVYDDALADGQTVYVVKGYPYTVAAYLTSIVDASDGVDLICETSANATYLVVLGAPLDASFLLLEDGGIILLEDGGFIQLEGG